MKGIVFTEFLEMVDQRFGEVVAERIIEESALPSGGAYTAVGTYDHSELVQLVGRLSAITQMPIPELLRGYGKHLFSRFVERYPHFFAGVTSCFGFLEGIEGYIHVEVRKLYPDAELPTIESRRVNDDRLDLTYRSSRPFGDFAEGLILGCIAHFRENISVAKQDASGGGKTCVRFTLTRRP